MREPIFREKSLEKVKSPDNLNEYIRVSNPGVWLLLTAITILLLGFCIWGIFGQIRTVVKADVHCENGAVTCFASGKNAGAVRPGMKITAAGHSGVITEVDLRADENIACKVSMDTPLADGIYTASIEIENLHPMSFLLN